MQLHVFLPLMRLIINTRNSYKLLPCFLDSIRCFKFLFFFPKFFQIFLKKKKKKQHNVTATKLPFTITFSNNWLICPNFHIFCIQMLWNSKTSKYVVWLHVHSRTETSSVSYRDYFIRQN